MATFQEFAKSYAERIRKAITSDGFTNRSRITQQSLQYSKTLQEIKAIKRDIDNLTYALSKKTITEDDKRKILELINQELGLSTQLRKSNNIVECASNDDLSDLADVIENVLSGRK